MIRFRMFRINVDQFAILADSPSSNVSIDSEMTFDISKENRNIRINIGFNFTDGTNSMMFLKMNCEFNIHKDDWNNLSSDGKMTIPKSLIDYFLVLKISFSFQMYFLMN